VIPNYTHEAVIVFFKGDWKPRDKTGQLISDQMAWLRESIWILGVESATASGHQSPYPVQLPYRCVTLWSLEGDIVFDPFIGSGTTLVACEKLGRRGRASELLPKYCAVTLERVAGMGVDCHLVERLAE
jgi:site-specific DNA-methyltransferase (adenine-specific)